MIVLSCLFLAYCSDYLLGPREFIWVSDWATPGCQYELIWILTCGIIRTTLEVGLRRIILKHECQWCFTVCCSFESWRDKDFFWICWRYKGDRPTKHLLLPYDLNVIPVIDLICLSWTFCIVYWNHILVLLLLWTLFGTLFRFSCHAISFTGSCDSWLYHIM